MIVWKDKEFLCGNSTHRLEIDDIEVLNVDFRASNKEYPFTFSSYWGSSAYIQEPLKAKTVEDAKNEALLWLIREFQTRADNMRKMIAAYEENVKKIQDHMETDHEKL